MSEEEILKAGDAWKRLLTQYPALEKAWSAIPEPTNTWFSQQIDIFAGKYPAQPVPVKPEDEKGMNTAWPLHDVLKRLTGAAEYLLDKKDYDGPDWEEIRHAINSAKTLALPLSPVKAVEDEIKYCHGKTVTDICIYPECKDLGKCELQNQAVEDEMDGDDLKECIVAAFKNNLTDLHDEEGNVIRGIGENDLEYAAKEAANEWLEK